MPPLRAARRRRGPSGREQAEGSYEHQRQNRTPHDPEQYSWAWGVSTGVTLRSLRRSPAARSAVNNDGHHRLLRLQP